MIGAGKQVTTTTSPIGLQRGDTRLVSKDRSIISTDTNAVDVTGERTIGVVNFGMMTGFDKAIRFHLYATNFDYTVVKGAAGRMVSSDGHSIYIGSNSQSSRTDTRIALSNADEITTIGQGGALFLFNAELVKLNNTALITSTDTGSTYKSITFFDVDMARITNSGTILAASNDFTESNPGDVAAFTFTGGSDDLVLHNSGPISAPLYSLASAATVHEAITTSGTLEGSNYLSDAIGGVLQNSGAIWGDAEKNGGNDDFRGYGDGDDTIVGGHGLDVLFGGAGADTFTYNSFGGRAEGGAFDRIRDFTAGEDKINRSAIAAGLDLTTGAFTGTGPEVRVQITSAGVPLVFVDDSGDAVADMRIALLGTAEPITESNFIL